MQLKETVNKALTTDNAPYTGRGFFAVVIDDASGHSIDNTPYFTKIQELKNWKLPEGSRFGETYLVDFEDGEIVWATSSNSSV